MIIDDHIASAPAKIDKQVNAVALDLITAKRKLLALRAYAENSRRLDDLIKAIEGVDTAIGCLIPF